DYYCSLYMGSGIVLF
nr:immunoglobulin light chain junction region [Macaca mulatta]MOW27480.1 immunoglobulin light chain junction region [Macaca mulatta]MOW28054.1 immunoglobulin light chain junction region [Macaca mulatta]MOW28718.1 immunoglobulin light chain junction region [Macaca mulatta]MOW29462.1 immunoglobulin light chain junction region [Macaca mulatta]